MPNLSILEINGVPYDLRDPTKAPAGYGLGGDANHGMPPIADANTATRNGWYHINTATANTPGVNGIMRVESYTEGSLKQTIFCTSWSSNYHAEFQRVCLNGAWTTEWDWVDPPMILGVEYRTTERWNGKAVYTKLINCGTGVDGSEYTLEEGCKIIRFCGHIAQAVTPYPADGSLTGSWSAYFSAWQNKIILHCGSSLSGTNDAYVAVWYYKL